MTAATAPGGAPPSEHRRLTHAVAAASDAVLGRIVAVFDRLPDRREADRLLDAARPRLRRLRPPRPIGLGRLLFLPLDGIIVDPRAWKRADGSIPRSALLPFAEALRAAIGSEAAAIEAAFAGATFADLRTVGATGGRLWQAAAAATPDMPARWADAGLAAADFGHCAALAAGVWRHAAPLWAALAAAPDGPPEDLVREAIDAAAGEAPIVAEAMLATILLRASRPGSVAAAAAAVRTLPAGVADRVLDRWIDHCRPDLSDDDPEGAAHQAEEFATALDDLEAAPAARRPERRQRILALRRQADEACRATFAASAAKALSEPLEQRFGAIDDAGMGAMERSARALKRLEQAGRKLGGGTAYDSAIRSLADGFDGLRAAPGANLADLARLTEILAGPEAAMRLFNGR